MIGACDEYFGKGKEDNERMRDDRVEAKWARKMPFYVISPRGMQFITIPNFQFQFSIREGDGSHHSNF